MLHLPSDLELRAKSTRDRSIQGRSVYIAEHIIALLDRFASVANDERWDGRELVLGIALAFRKVTEGIGMSPAQALQTLIGVDTSKMRNADVGRIVSPYGRPLAKPPGSGIPE